MSDGPAEETVLGVDVVGRENVDYVFAVLQSQDMRDLCLKLLVPALSKMAHDSMSGRAAGTHDFESGRYDMLAEIIGVISE